MGSAEVGDGKCDLVMDSGSRVLRVVSVVVFQLERYDQKVLVQIGKYTGTDVTPACALPGTKVRAGELPRDALQRLLDRQFTLFQPAVVVERPEVAIEVKVSKAYGVNTKYVRTIFHARLDAAYIISLPMLQRSSQASTSSCSASDDS